MYTFDENIDRIEQAKSDIKAAIEEKGVYVGDGNINTYANKVRMIKERGKMQKTNVTITENNTTTSVVPDDGYVGLEKVTINTEIPFENGETRTYTKNGTYALEPTEGYKAIENATIVVDVQADEKPQLPNGITFSGSTWETFDMGEYDWSNHYYFAQMFNNCNKLKHIVNMPENLKPYGSTYKMFYFTKLIELPMIDLSCVGNTTEMFCLDKYTSDGERPTVIPPYDMHNVVIADSMFGNLRDIVSIPLLDFTNMKSCVNIFSTGNYGVKATEVGGFLNVRCNLDLWEFRRITVESIYNVLNYLYDFNANHIVPDSTEGKITFGKGREELFTDEMIAIAINKGWTIVFE